MAAKPYWIELRGGRFDGYRRALYAVPSETRLELPMTSLADTATIPSNRSLAVYERRQTAVVQVDGVPTMIFKYDFAGTKTLPATTRKNR